MVDEKTGDDQGHNASQSSHAAEYTEFHNEILRRKNESKGLGVHQVSWLCSERVGYTCITVIKCRDIYIYVRRLMDIEKCVPTYAHTRILNNRQAFQYLVYIHRYRDVSTYTHTKLHASIRAYKHVPN